VTPLSDSAAQFQSLLARNFVDNFLYRTKKNGLPRQRPGASGKSLSVRFRATGIAVHLEDKGTSETAQKIDEAEFSIVFSLF
jgi:hypothetical protein